MSGLGALGRQLHIDCCHTVGGVGSRAPMFPREVLAARLLRGRKSLPLHLGDGGSQPPFRHGARIGSDGLSFECEGLAERSAGL